MKIQSTKDFTQYGTVFQRFSSAEAIVMNSN